MTIRFEDMKENEKTAIKQFRERISDVTPPMEPDFLLHDLHLLRFLRARKTVDKAEVMYRKFMAWLEEVQFAKALTFVIRDEIVDNFPWKISGVDNAGGPVVVVPVGQWEPGNVNDLLCDDLVKLALRSLAQICGVIVKQQKDKGIATQATGIADLKGLGLKHVANVEGIKATLTMIKYFEQNFPEHLRVVFVLNAPYVFSMVWKLIRPLLTGNTHEKIRFVYSNYEKEIGEFVDPDQLPTQYGGTLSNDSEIMYDGKDFRRVSSNRNCEQSAEDLIEPLRI